MLLVALPASLAARGDGAANLETEDLVVGCSLLRRGGGGGGGGGS